MCDSGMLCFGGGHNTPFQFPKSERWLSDTGVVLLLTAVILGSFSKYKPQNKARSFILLSFA